MKQLLTGLLLLWPVCLSGLQQQSTGDNLLKQSTFSAEQRLLDLAKIWSEGRFSFAYYNTIAVGWDKLYQQFIPRVLAAKTDYNYYLELMRFGAHLRDGHSGVFWPRAYSNALGYPPLEIRKIQGRAVIFSLLRETDELSRHRIRPGLEIVQVDGRPVAERISHWRELMCASTDQARDRLAYFRILTGPRNSSVEIVVKAPDGEPRTVRLRRSEKYFADTNLTPPQPFSTRKPVQGIGYFRANMMRAPVNQAFAEYLERAADLHGLVLDLRYNGGGSDLISFDLVGRLIDAPLAGPIYEVTAYRADRRALRKNPEIIRVSADPIAPASGRRFTGWLVVLIGEQTHSATEGGFLSVIKSRPQTVLVGEPTAGSTGQPMIFKLATGGIGAVCSRRSLSPNGSEFVGEGFRPDISASLTQNDLYKGRDSVVDSAFEILREKLSLRE